MKIPYRAIAAALVTVAALTACGTDGKTAAAPSASPTISPALKFLSSVGSSDIDKSNWQNGEPTDQQLTDLPPKWCRAAEQGHTVEWMLAGDGSDQLYPIGAEWGTLINDAYTMVLLGVTAYCPEYRSEVIQELRDNGQY